MGYPKERKEAILNKMMPPHNVSIPELALQKGSSPATLLYGWRNQAYKSLVFFALFAFVGCSKPQQVISSPRENALLLKKNAAALFKKKKYARSIECYRRLITLAPNGPEAPQFQNKIVRATQHIGNHRDLGKEVIALMQFFEAGHPWEKRWKGKHKVWNEASERAEQILMEFSTKYHQKGQKEERKQTKKAESFYNLAIQLYEYYLKYYSHTESAYDLRFFLAELLYRKAQKATPLYEVLSPVTQKAYIRALRQYHKVTQIEPNGRPGQYLKKALYGKVLCFEALVGSRGDLTLRGTIGKSRIDQFKWTLNPTNRSPWLKKLLLAYKRYLKIAKIPKERIQAYLKISFLHILHKRYKQAIAVLLTLNKQYPKSPLRQEVSTLLQKLRENPSVLSR